MICSPFCSPFGSIMIAIADKTHKVPSYLFKVINKIALITVDINQAKVFNSQEAKETLDIIKEDPLFKFEICQLKI